MIVKWKGHTISPKPYHWQTGNSLGQEAVLHYIRSNFVLSSSEYMTAGDVYQDFDIVAKRLGCNYGDETEPEIDCKRQGSWVQIA
jgi:hypothetical protein